MTTSLHPWVAAMLVAVENIRNHPDLKAVKYYPMLIKHGLPTFVGLPQAAYSANNDNAKPSG